jgi:hypothetical protein
MRRKLCRMPGLLSATRMPFPGWLESGWLEYCDILTPRTAHAAVITSSLKFSKVARPMAYSMYWIDDLLEKEELCRSSPAMYRFGYRK